MTKLPMDRKAKIRRVVITLVAFGIFVCLLRFTQTPAFHGMVNSITRSHAPWTPKALNLTYEFSEGWLLSHDVYVTNTSGSALSETHLTLTIIGENASPSVDRYWSDWPLGVKQHIMVPIDQVTHVQQVTILGRSDQGVFEKTLWPQR